MYAKEQLINVIERLLREVLSDVAFQSRELNGEYHITFNLPGGTEFTKVVSEREYLDLMNENILIQIRNTLEQLDIK